MNDLITIATFTYPLQAQISKGLLESNGIECFLQDENTITASPFYSNALGGVKLLVREENAEQALQILNESPETPLN